MAEPFDPQKIKLTEQKLECLTYIEQQYMLEGQVPTSDRISDVFGVSKATARKWLDSDEFNYMLGQRGIHMRRRSGVLTAPQLMIINMLLNIADRRSKREKCNDAGIKLQQLAAWQRDPQFNEYMQKRAEQLFKSSDDVAYLNVVKNMESGNLRAAEFYFEMTGKFRKTVDHNINIDGFLVSLIEIIQARVQDPAVLELIAGDIDNLMSGKPADLHGKPEYIPAESVEVPKGELVTATGIEIKLNMSGV